VGQVFNMYLKRHRAARLSVIGAEGIEVIKLVISVLQG